ncbi:MAG: GNAT family N-acetyltransferase [Candidatus Latescibacteria bacterium]|nr:GNAT family N-acetyltransferase [Candidatus Latescibacterota bacterium]
MIGFRTSTQEDFDLLVELRLAFMLEGKDPPAAAEYQQAKEAYAAYLRDQLGHGCYVGYLGFVAGQPACVAGLLLYDLPPLLHRLRRKLGHVLNFYTLPAHRHQGYGTALMQFIVEDARRRGLDRLFLNATAMGEPLYRKFGFVDSSPTALQLDL